MNLSSHRRLVWVVPAAVTGAVVTAALLPGLAAGSGSPTLPTRTAAELLVAVQTSTTQALSGTVVETARLGLPDLPGADHSASLSWQSLVSGSHTARVWADGPDRQRLALIGQLAESDVVHNGTDLWTYSSADNAVTHAVLPAHTSSKPEPTSTEVPLTPQQAAAKALAAIDPSTVVAVDGTQRVADRPAYTLSLTPKDTRSTVRQVLIAVDSETSVPLRVQVYGAGASPALETGFTDVSFSRPAASVFRFSPPANATVTEKDLPGTGDKADASTPAGAPDKTASTPTVIGAGWTSILSLPASSTTASAGKPAGGGGSVLDQLTKVLPNGDRLLTTSLVNALMTADGRVFVGAVTPDLLQKAAAGTAG
jgi:outer membrane lipoprotein-sorting protein